MVLACKTTWMCIPPKHTHTQIYIYIYIYTYIYIYIFNNLYTHTYIYITSRSGLVMITMVVITHYPHSWMVNKHFLLCFPGSLASPGFEQTISKIGTCYYWRHDSPLKKIHVKKQADNSQISSQRNVQFHEKNISFLWLLQSMRISGS